jgi:hypothetical protein
LLAKSWTWAMPSKPSGPEDVKHCIVPGYDAWFGMTKFCRAGTKSEP